jgi:large subunit ribosomal protein L32
MKAPVPAVTRCPKCGDPKQPHRVCPTCGTYRGEQVVEVEEI